MCENKPIKCNLAMKHLFILLLVVLSVTSICANKPLSKPNHGTEIPINPSIPTNDPRTNILQIEANYNGEALTIVFNRDLGNAEIVVTNTTTGESWYDGVNGIGSTVITLSGDEGYYEIYIYTDCGDYTGTFII